MTTPALSKTRWVVRGGLTFGQGCYLKVDAVETVDGRYILGGKARWVTSRRDASRWWTPGQAAAAVQLYKVATRHWRIVRVTPKRSAAKP